MSGGIKKKLFLLLFVVFDNEKFASTLEATESDVGWIERRTALRGLLLP